MKILKYIGIVLALLVAAFLSLGLWVSSFEYSSTTTVLAPPEKCWAVLHDTSRMKKWMPGFQRMTLKSGEGGQPNAVYEVVVRQDELYIMQEKLKVVKAPEFASFEMTNEVMAADYDFTLQPDQSGTRITNNYKVTGNNLVWRAILFLSKSYLQKGSQTHLDLLKLEIETGEVEFD